MLLFNPYYREIMINKPPEMLVGFIMLAHHLCSNINDELT